MQTPSLALSRRDVLKTASCGFGYLAWAGLHATASTNPLLPQRPHFKPRAKNVIFMFMRGGPSQVDTFDYKPELDKVDGKPVTPTSTRKYWKSPWKFSQHGESGLWISELFPNVAKHADELCLLNSMHTDVGNHPQAMVQMHTGSFRFARPSMGSWILYGLGTENQCLPGFITLCPSMRQGGANNFGNAFLPAATQGTPILNEGADVTDDVTLSNVTSRLDVSRQRRKLDLLQSLNQERLERDVVNDPLEGIIQAHELGFRMQTSIPEVMDLSRETKQTHANYGIGVEETDDFGRQCLLARRFVESGVRFVQLNTGRWDNHVDLVPMHGMLAKSTDRPIAALIADLKQRGLLDETLLVWGGEFGRPPLLNNTKGRDHDHLGYTMWLAGGGVRGGLRFGSTDEFGYKAADKPVHLHDLHATILALLGLDHERLTYRYSGRDFRLTDVYGNVVEEIMTR